MSEETFRRRISIDPMRTQEQALQATGCVRTIDSVVIARMPYGKIEEDVVFFRGSRRLTNRQLAKVYAAHGLRAASPISLAAVNEEDPTFAGHSPNATQFKIGGRWCTIAFGVRSGVRTIRVVRGPIAWAMGIWFAGVEL